VIEHVIFDLDGTLTDPSLGITRCWAHALTQLGYPSPPLPELERFIGPSIRQVAAELFATQDDALIERAISVYRERFSTVGLFENEVYAGIDALLPELSERGCTLWLCTAKPWVFAEQIVRHFGFSSWLRRVYGPELDGTREDKSELLRYLIARESLPASASVMIGDRKHDALAANANGLASVGVLYGFGDEAELKAAGAQRLCATVEALRATLAELTG